LDGENSAALNIWHILLFLLSAFEFVLLATPNLKFVPLRRAHDQVMTEPKFSLLMDILSCVSDQTFTWTIF